MGSRVTEDFLRILQRRLPEGHANAVSGGLLAIELGIDERTLRELVGELIDRGVLVGSDRNGYYLITTQVELEIGTRHLISRARSMFRRVSRLRRSAEAEFGPEALTLFDLDSEEVHA